MEEESLDKSPQPFYQGYRHVKLNDGSLVSMFVILDVTEQVLASIALASPKLEDPDTREVLSGAIQFFIGAGMDEAGPIEAESGEEALTILAFRAMEFVKEQVAQAISSGDEVALSIIDMPEESEILEELGA